MEKIKTLNEFIAESKKVNEDRYALYMESDRDWKKIWDQFHNEYKKKSTTVALNFFEWLQENYMAPNKKD